MKMPPITLDILKLQDVLDAITDLYGFDYEQLGNRRNLKAAAFCFTIIGEAANQISDEFKKKHTDILWREMRNNRNRIVHEYGDLDRKIMIEIIEDDLPLLENTVRQILKHYTP